MNSIYLVPFFFGESVLSCTPGSEKPDGEAASCTKGLGDDEEGTTAGECDCLEKMYHIIKLRKL